MLGWAEVTSRDDVMVVQIRRRSRARAARHASTTSTRTCAATSAPNPSRHRSSGFCRATARRYRTTRSSTTAGRSSGYVLHGSSSDPTHGDQLSPCMVTIRASACQRRVWSPAAPAAAEERPKSLHGPQTSRKAFCATVEIGPTRIHQNQMQQSRSGSRDGS